MLRPLVSEMHEPVCCIDCRVQITKAQRAFDGRCKHCNGLVNRGKSDIDNCFQGSVILLDD